MVILKTAFIIKGNDGYYTNDELTESSHKYTCIDYTTLAGSNITLSIQKMSAPQRLARKSSRESGSDMGVELSSGNLQQTGVGDGECEDIISQCGDARQITR